MTASQVEVELKITVSDSVVNAALSFTNTSSENSYIEKINGCIDGKIKNDVFHISTDGREVEYIGILAKRRPPGPDDFVTLRPKEKVSIRVRLNDAYDFPPGSHTYKACYEAFHSFPDRDGFIELKSNEVTFSLTK